MIASVWFLCPSTKSCITMSLSISTFGILLISNKMLSGNVIFNSVIIFLGIIFLVILLISSGKYTPELSGPLQLCGSSVLASSGINFPLSDLNSSSQ